MRCFRGQNRTKKNNQIFIEMIKIEKQYLSHVSMSRTCIPYPRIKTPIERIGKGYNGVNFSHSKASPFYEFLKMCFVSKQPSLERNWVRYSFIRFLGEIFTCKCSISENGGLAVYSGKDGLFSLLKTLHLIETQKKVVRIRIESSYAQDCMQCSFANRTDLDNLDYRYAISSWHTCHGKQTGLLYRRYRLLR